MEMLNAFKREDIDYIRDYSVENPEEEFEKGTNIILEAIRYEQVDFLMSIFNRRKRKQYYLCPILFCIENKKWEIGMKIMDKVIFIHKEYVKDYNDENCIFFEKLKENNPELFENSEYISTGIYCSSDYPIRMDDWKNFLNEFETIKCINGFMFNCENRKLYFNKECSICNNEEEMHFLYFKECMHSICITCYFGLKEYKCPFCKTKFTQIKKFMRIKDFSCQTLVSYKVPNKTKIFTQNELQQHLNSLLYSLT